MTSSPTDRSVAARYVQNILIHSSSDNAKLFHLSRTELHVCDSLKQLAGYTVTDQKQSCAVSPEAIGSLAVAVVGPLSISYRVAVVWIWRG